MLSNVPQEEARYNNNFDRQHAHQPALQSSEEGFLGIRFQRIPIQIHQKLVLLIKREPAKKESGIRKLLYQGS